MKKHRTISHDGGVVFFVSKRHLLILRRYVTDENNLPITFNKEYQADAFIRGDIKYRDYLGGLKYRPQDS